MQYRSLIAAAAAFAAALAVCESVASVHAQPQARRPDANTVAAWVQTFYDQTRTMRARFEQRYENAVYQRTDRSSGRVSFRKPGMMRFDYAQPNGKVVVSDGRRLIVFEPPDTPRGRGQYYEQQMGQAQLPAALSFLTGTGSLARDFTFGLLSPQRSGYADGEVLQLRSRRPSPQFSTILLYVERNPQRRGIVQRVLIVDHSNNRNRFDFLDQHFNEAIPETVFRWRPPGNARRIQP
jgi:outer membrane lipoprotein carrier protein